MINKKEYCKEWRRKNKQKIKEYLSRPEVIINRKKWQREWRERNREKERAYKQRPEIKIKRKLRKALRRALYYYTTSGKICSSSKYGINYKAIIEHLKPFPEDISKYHIDHIKPLCSFNLEDPEQIKLAFSPENHQWLLAKDNLRKGSKF